MPLIRSSSMLFGRLCFVAVSAALLAVLPQSAGQASAAGSCPTAAAFTAGDGSAGNAFEISTPGHLQYLHDNVQTNYYKLANDIDMGGCVWTSGIPAFGGVLDGQGHVVNGLSITATSPSTTGLGFIDRLKSGGQVKNIGFTGNVTATVTRSGSVSLDAGGLVGSMDGGTKISNSFTTGAVTVSLTANALSSMGAAYAQAMAYVGGVVGQASNAVEHVYAMGPVSGSAVVVPMGTGSYTSQAFVGGVVGSQGSGSVTGTFATGSVSGSASGGSSPLARTGALVGNPNATVSSSVWDEVASGQSSAFGYGSVNATATKSSAMKTLATYADSPVSWLIASGFDPTQRWGICPSVNGGYPFLTAFYTANPCAPTITSLLPAKGSGAGGTSLVITGSDFTGATSVKFGGVEAISFAVNSAGTEITAESPSGTAGDTVDVVVTTPQGAGTLADGFAYLLEQTVTWSPVTAVTTAQSPLTPSTLATALGGATISYEVTAHTTATCSVDAATGVLTFTGAGTCNVGAVAAATSTYDEGRKKVTFTSSLVPQTMTVAATKTTLNVGDTASLSTSGSLGTGAVGWSVTAGPGVCRVSGSTVTALAAGTCTVSGTVAADAMYAEASDSLVLTVRAASNAGGGGSSGGSSGGASAGISSGAAPVSQSSGPVLQPTLPPITPPVPAAPPSLNTGSALVNGQPAVASVTDSSTGLAVVVPGTDAQFSIERGGVQRSRASAAFATGVPTGFSAQGMQPGAPVTIYAMSTPVLVGTVVADASGRVDGLITLPASLGTGRHTLVVSGYLPGGAPLTAYVGIATTSAKSTLLRRVYFPLGSAELGPRMKARLSRLVAAARAGDPVTVTVGVVRSGATRAERVLAAQRARSVADYLRANGMPGTVRVGASIPTRLDSWAARRAEVSVTMA